MQQKLEKRRGSFGAGLFASVVLHVAIAALLLFRLAPAAPEPEKEETVKVEMVPEPEKKSEPEKKPEPEKKSEPEKKPEPEKKLEQKPEPRAKPQAEMKPMEKPAIPAKAEPRPAEKRAEPRKNQPQAFESAAKEGAKEAGGDTPSKPLPQPEVEPRADRAAPPVESKVTEKTEEEIQKSDDTPEASKPPELDLPETANAAQPLNEGEAAIRMVPKPVSKPEQKPADATLVNPEQSASFNSNSTDAKPRRPPSELQMAKELYSANALSDARIRQALGKLPRDRRIVQICIFEMNEQARRARPETLPEALVAFSDEGGRIAGQVLTTDSAFISRGVWYKAEFQCTVNKDADTVTAFRFAIGGAMSEGERKARRLPDN